MKWVIGCGSGPLEGLLLPRAFGLARYSHLHTGVQSQGLGDAGCLAAAGSVNSWGF